MKTPLVPGATLACLAGHGFRAPTYTQTPNELFAALPCLSDPQLRCLLIIIRFTLGYHHTTCYASLSDIQRETGLSRPAVSKAMQQLDDGGLVLRVRHYPRSQWRLNISEDTHIKLSEDRPKPKTQQARLW